VSPQLYAIFDSATLDDSWLTITGSSVTLTALQIDRSECVLGDFVGHHNAMGPSERDSIAMASGNRIRSERLIEDWYHYFRQYAGEITANGDTLVHLNAFCEIPRNSEVYAFMLKEYLKEHPSVVDASGDTLRSYKQELLTLDELKPDGWRRHWVHVDDGGDCYFQAVLNISRERVEVFSVNGRG
jgi:hypothetical protein